MHTAINHLLFHPFPLTTQLSQFLPVPIHVLRRVQRTLLGPHTFQPEIRCQDWPSLGPCDGACAVRDIECSGMDLFAWLEGSVDAEPRDYVLVGVGGLEGPGCAVAGEGNAGVGTFEGTVEGEVDAHCLSHAVCIAEGGEADLFMGFRLVCLGGVVEGVETYYHVRTDFTP